MKEIVIVVVIFYIGFITGFFFKGWLSTKTGFDGVVRITRSEDKVLYSLELVGDPEEIEFQKKLVFKVDASEQSPNRD